MRRAARLLLALAATAIACFAASLALAGSQPDPRPGDKQLGTKGGITYVSDTATSSDPSFAQSSAACPGLDKGKWRIAGGGFRTNDKAGAITATRPQDLYIPPDGDVDSVPDDFWESDAEIAVGKKVSSYAICMKSEGLSYQLQSQPDESDAIRSSTQSCSGKSQPTGGGGFIATTDSYLSSVFPTGKNKWRVDLLDATGGHGGMQSQVVCLHDKQLRRATTKVTMPSAKVKSAKATCKGGAHVTGGGIRMGKDGGDGIALASYPVDGKDADKVPDDGWKVQGYNRTAGTLPLTAYAICKG